MSPPYWQLTVPVPDDVSEGLTNFLWELGALGVVEDGALCAFFPPESAPAILDARVRAYLEGLGALGYAVDGATPSVTPVTDRLWAEAWKEHFRPIAVGTRLLIAPPWDVPTSSRTVIVIEPGRAFGTGHHGSTAGCLVLLERLLGHRRTSRRTALAPASSDPRRAGPTIDRALDLGTGSGILAIAAARLGVPSVLAVDEDPDAIAAATANSERNDVTDRVRCALADAHVAGGVERCARDRRGAFRLVLANLLTTTHRGLADRYRALVAPGGRLVLGGMLTHEAHGVADFLAGSGFDAVDREVVDGWTSLALARSSAQGAAGLAVDRSRTGRVDSYPHQR
jgi:ribosomal protein L11 methyltransferase